MEATGEKFEGLRQEMAKRHREETERMRARHREEDRANSEASRDWDVPRKVSFLHECGKSHSSEAKLLRERQKTEREALHSQLTAERSRRNAGKGASKPGPPLVSEEEELKRELREMEDRLISCKEKLSEAVSGNNWRLAEYLCLVIKHTAASIEHLRQAS